MSISSEITRLEAAKASIKEAIITKGVAVPSGTTLDGFAALIADIMLSITTDTDTNITGLIKGYNGKAAEAIKGQDYSSPALLRTATLTAAGWSNKSQTVTVSGVLADSTKQAINVSPAGGHGAAYGAAGIECTAQGANSLTFSCETAPESDITVNISIQEATT